MQYSHLPFILRNFIYFFYDAIYQLPACLISRILKLLSLICLVNKSCYANFMKLEKDNYDITSIIYVYVTFVMIIII